MSNFRFQFVVIGCSIGFLLCPNALGQQKTNSNKAKSKNVAPVKEQTGLKHNNSKSVAKPDSKISVRVHALERSDPMFGALEAFAHPHLGELYAHKRRGDVSKVDLQCLRVGEFKDEPGKYLLDWAVRGRVRNENDFVERLDVVVEQRSGRLQVRSVTAHSRKSVSKDQQPTPKVPDDSSGKPLERI